MRTMLRSHTKLKHHRNILSFIRMPFQSNICGNKEVSLKPKKEKMFINLFQKIRLIKLCQVIMHAKKASSIKLSLLFLLQLLLLPLYLLLFLDKSAASIVEVEPFFHPLFLLIIIPLVIALSLQL